jgi:hypothetical protein
MEEQRKSSYGISILFAAAHGIGRKDNAYPRHRPQQEK